VKTGSTSQVRRLKLEDVPWSIHAIALGGFLFVSLVVAWFYFQYREVDFWASWRASGELRKPAYAEAIFQESIFRTRMNTWSNLAYVLVGFYVMALALHDLRWAWPKTAGYVVHTPALSFLFGLACAYLGFGSGIFHASLTRWGQQLDVAAMYSPLVVLIAINLGRLFPKAGSFPLWPQWAICAMIASALLYVYKWEMASGQVLPTLIAVVGLFGLTDLFRPNASLAIRWLGVAFVFLVLAFVCRQLDVAGRFTGPDAFFQGHALWHVFSAVTLGAAYLYHRSEETSGAPGR
jgi:hypothetical protein